MDKNRKWCFTADPEKVVECFLEGRIEKITSSGDETYE